MKNNHIEQMYPMYILADEQVAHLCHSEVEQELLPTPIVLTARSFSPDIASKSILILQLEQLPAQSQLVAYWLKKNDRAIICISADILDAYKAWVLGASDFILLSDQYKLDIAESVKKATSMLRAQLLLLNENVDVQFTVGNGGVLNIQAHEILYIEASGDYCWCYTKNKKEAIHSRLGACEKMLRSFGFQRIHRSLLVNPRHIKLRHGKSLMMSNGVEIIMAKRRNSSEV